MADDDSANEARKGREAADAAREERGAASAKASDEAGASVASGAGSQAAAKGSSKAADEGPPTYTLDRLTADSFGFLGVEQHVAAGALHGVTEKEMTIKDAKARVKAWLKSEVDTGPDEEA